VVRVSAERAPNLVVMVDGKALGEGSWGAALPMDPGEHSVEASAPGWQPWAGRVRVEAGPSVVEVAVPALELAPALPPPVEEKKDWSTQRYVALAVGTAGVVGLAAGGGFGIAAIARNNASMTGCLPEDPRQCNKTGYAARREAGTLADASTATLSVGGALVVAGVLVFVMAPKEERGTSARIVPIVAPGNLGIWMQTEW
jgi:hypothetical protein